MSNWVSNYVQLSKWSQHGNTMMEENQNNFRPELITWQHGPSFRHYAIWPKLQFHGTDYRLRLKLVNWLIPVELSSKRPVLKQELSASSFKFQKLQRKSNLAIWPLEWNGCFRIRNLGHAADASGLDSLIYTSVYSWYCKSIVRLSKCFAIRAFKKFIDLYTYQVYFMLKLFICFFFLKRFS